MKTSKEKGRNYVANLTLEYAISTYKKKCIACQDEIKKEHSKATKERLERQYEVYFSLATWLSELQIYRNQDIELALDNLPQNIRFLILKNHLTQHEFCKMTQMSSATLYKILCVKCNPKVETLLAIAKTFGVSADWLLAKHDI